MTDAEELIDLAEMLERKAKWSDARAAMAKHDATINPQKEVTNAAYCRRKAEVCRLAAKSLSEPKKKRASVAKGSPDSPEFNAFWAAYPRRVGKGHARGAWQKWKCDGKADAIMAALERAKKSHDWTRERGQFIPHPATWLNREGWEDDFTAPKLPLKPAQNQADPPGWREWLKSLNRPYIEHWRAQPYQRDDFKKTKRP